MATDKESLTVEEALAEFPEECCVLLRYDPFIDKAMEGCTRGFDAIDKTRRAWYFLVGTALRWLEGKDRRHGKYYSDGDALLVFFPRDWLRWLLEEVRAQLKREQDNGNAG